MLIHYFIALIVAGIVHLSLAIFVLFKGIKRRINQTYALYSASIAIWAIFEAFGITAYDRNTALFLWRINHMGVIFISIGFVHFVYCVTNITGWKRKLIPISYIIAFIFAITNCTKLLILEVVPKFSFRYFINPGSLYGLFFSIWILWIIYGLIELFRAYFKATGDKRNQLKYFCWSMLIAYIGGVPNFFPTFNIIIPILMPFGTYAIPTYAFFTVYAMFKYRLMDITLYSRRAFIFVIVTIIIMGLSFGVTSFTKENLIKRIGDDWWYIPFVVSMLFAVVGYAFSIYVIKKMDEIRLARLRDAQESLETSGRGMIEIDNIHRLAKIIPRYITKLYYSKLNISIEHATIFLCDEQKKAFILESSAGNKRLSKDQDLQLGHPFNIWFNDKRKIFLDKKIVKKQDVDVLRYEDIEYLINNSKALDEDGSLHELFRHMKEEMNRLRSVICIPSFYKGEPMGFLLLGNKNQGTYNQEELDIFSRLATNAAAAFRGAQLTSQIKQMQMGLIASGQLAAIGRLATSAKHEVNNPLQGIYGSIQLTLSHLKEVRNDYKLIKDRINTYKDRADGAFSNLIKNKDMIGAEKISEIKEKLQLVDRTFTIINERADDDEKFSKNLDVNIKNIEDFQAKLKIYSESIPEEKVRDQIDEMALSLHTVTMVLNKIKKSNQTLFDTIEKGRKDCERITEVIEIMYHLPRPDAKDKSDFTLEELLEKSFYFVRFQTYWENLSDTPIEKEIPEDLPKIRGLMGGLAITFLNLIMNAYQAMTDAGLTLMSQRLVKIAASVPQDDPDFMEIRVSNKGPLIPENDLERIFEAGFTTKKKGTGMGLNICKAIIEFYNKGSIYARNIPGFGPEFVIKLPIAKEAK